MEMKLDQLEKSEKKMEEQLKAEIQGSQEAIKKLLDEKLNGFQTQSEAQLRNQIEQLTAELSCIDQKVSQEKERNLQTVDSMQFATRDELQQQISLLDKKFSTSEPNPEISRMEMKLDQLEKSEKKMEERLKAEIQGSQEAIKKLWDEKLNGFQTQSEAQLRNQIERLTAELSCIDQKVSQEKERNLQTVDTMQFAIRDELQQQISLLDKKFSTSEPNPEISRMEMKLDQLEKSEKKMEERLKAEIQGSQEAIKKLLDEKLNGVQTQSEAQLRNQIERLTAELSCIDQKVSLEIERKLNTIERMQFASRDELQEQISLLDKKLSTSEPNLEINYVEKKLDHLKKLELEKVRTELDWRRARNNADDITLDADTAHPNLSIAGDKKSFTYAAQPQKVRTTPQRFDSTVCVLGSEVFSKGKHYWEVDVESSTDWDLGVARKSVTKKGKLSLCPKEGFWVLGQSGRDYWVKTDPWTRVMVQKKPKKIGVYLSYQERQVTFFNVNDMSVLFIFKNCSFSEEVCPFFKNSHKETTMQICSVKED
ncbi:uncharacterized protein LOC142823418 [Pelodiscus sinensis]|uniref:uncharacterized protein LOC142823418 n=1 Tax=Pelodiscus sinensis TaxID=13735 RepID=UPI003F6BCE29